MMEAVLSNADHPEYGVATIPLPIPRNQYDHCVALLEALEIGDASEADCRLDSLDSAWPVLNRLVCTKVNLDELDYLEAITAVKQTDDSPEVQELYNYLINYDLGNVIDIPLTYYKDLILYNTDKIASYEFSDVPAFFDVSGLQPAA